MIQLSAWHIRKNWHSMTPVQFFIFLRKINSCHSFTLKITLVVLHRKTSRRLLAKSPIKVRHTVMHRLCKSEHDCESPGGSILEFIIHAESTTLDLWSKIAWSISWRMNTEMPMRTAHSNLHWPARATDNWRTRIDETHNTTTGTASKSRRSASRHANNCFLNSDHMTHHVLLVNDLVRDNDSRFHQKLFTALIKLIPTEALDNYMKYCRSRYI